MSDITNVLILCDLDELDDHQGNPCPAMDEVNRYLAAHNQGPASRLDEHVAGSPGFERAVFGAAYNGLPQPVILAAIEAAPWRYPDSVQVLICEQQDTLFSCYRVLTRR